MTIEEDKSKQEKLISQMSSSDDTTARGLEAASSPAGIEEAITATEGTDVRSRLKRLSIITATITKIDSPAAPVIAAASLAFPTPVGTLRDALAGAADAVEDTSPVDVTGGLRDALAGTADALKDGIPVDATDSLRDALAGETNAVRNTLAVDVVAWAFPTDEALIAGVSGRRCHGLARRGKSLVWPGSLVHPRATRFTAARSGCRLGWHGELLVRARVRAVDAGDSFHESAAWSGSRFGWHGELLIRARVRVSFREFHGVLVCLDSEQASREKVRADRQQTNKTISQMSSSSSTGITTGDVWGPDSPSDSSFFITGSVTVGDLKKPDSPWHLIWTKRVDGICNEGRIKWGEDLTFCITPSDRNPAVWGLWGHIWSVPDCTQLGRDAMSPCSVIYSDFPRGDGIQVLHMTYGVELNSGLETPYAVFSDGKLIETNIGEPGVGNPEPPRGIDDSDYSEWRLACVRSGEAECGIERSAGYLICPGVDEISLYAHTTVVDRQRKEIEAVSGVLPPDLAELTCGFLSPLPSHQSPVSRKRKITD